MSWRCFLLWHHWRPQAVKTVEMWDKRESSERPVELYTNVLLRCEHCSRFKVRKIDGPWTLEQLLLGEEMHDSPHPKVRA